MAALGSARTVRRAPDQREAVTAWKSYSNSPLFSDNYLAAHAHQACILRNCQNCFQLFVNFDFAVFYFIPFYCFCNKDFCIF